MTETVTEKVALLKVRCPRCGERVAWKDNPFRPFCCEKCRLIDLGRWADEDYLIPGPDAPTVEPDLEE